MNQAPCYVFLRFNLHTRWPKTLKQDRPMTMELCCSWTKSQHSDILQHITCTHIILINIQTCKRTHRSQMCSWNGAPNDQDLAQQRLWTVSRNSRSPSHCCRVWWHFHLLSNYIQINPSQNLILIFRKHCSWMNWCSWIKWSWSHKGESLF